MGFILLIDGDLDTLSYPPGLDGLLKSSRGVITAKRSPVSMGSYFGVDKVTDVMFRIFLVLLENL